MIKLLRAGYRRYFRNILFWISLFAFAVLGIASGVRVKEDARLDDVYVIIGFLIYAAFLSLMIGREFSDGGFRNKIASGHTKGTVFASECIVALSVCFILSLASVCVFLLFNASAFGHILQEVLIKSAIGYIFLIISMVTMIFIVSVLISKKAAAAVFALLLVFGSYLAAYELDSALSCPEYQMEAVLVDGMVQFNEGKIKNPDYIDSPVREKLTFAFNIIPIGQAMEYNSMVVPLFDPLNVIASVDEESAKTLNTLPLYSVGTSLVLLAGAYVLFRKKDIK